MPLLSIKAPQGIRSEAERRMMQKLTEAIDEAYHIGDALETLHQEMKFFCEGIRTRS